MKTRTVVWMVVGVLLLGTATRAQEKVEKQERPWIEKMFSDGITKDFGVVAHGAQLFYRFPITNIYKVPLDIIEVRPSCGLCVQAKESKHTLGPNETGYIEVHMDTTRFVNAKKVTVHVAVAGTGFNSSTDLVVTAVSRQDVVFNPGQVNFGLVNVGDTPSREIDVEYAGALAPGWKITDVVANDAPVEITFKEFYRTTPAKPASVGYKIIVTLKKDAPAGALKHELLLKTNDPANPQWSLFMDATVQEALSVTPGTVALGTLKVGEETGKSVILRGIRDFRVLAVTGLGPDLAVDTPVPSVTPKAVQGLKFKWRPTTIGDFKREVEIKTDLQEAPVKVTVEGTGQ